MPDASDPNKTKGEGEGGTDPTKTATSSTQAIDVSKLGDEDFAKVFDDPRLWNHPRFKSLNETAKKAREYEAAEEKRKQEELTKKGEWEALAKTHEAKAKEAQGKYLQSVADNRIQAEAAKSGAVDLEAVTKLIDRANIKVADDGTISGVEDAVKALLESKPYLKTGATQTHVGSGTAPGTENQQGLKRFKLSQLQDAAFFRANEKDIQASMKANLVEDDLPH